MQKFLEGGQLDTYKQCIHDTSRSIHIAIHSEMGLNIFYIVQRKLLQDNCNSYTGIMMRHFINKSPSCDHVIMDNHKIEGGSMTWQNEGL